MTQDETSTMQCAICRTPLRISPAAGKEGLGFSRVSEMGGVDELMRALKKPPRHVCPDCGGAWCPDCLPDLLCPNCKTRVRLG
ncbi:MAG: hypothetical protein ACE5FQ_12355 [Thiogranum sp.]